MGLSTTVPPRSTVPSAGRRRDPMQERSQETVGRVLAAAGRLLARGIAPQALTTAQIAAEAGLSVGALYRFFPDKQAVVDAIAARHLETFQDALAAALMAEMPQSEAAFLAAVINGFAAYLTAHADFRTLAYGVPSAAAGAVSGRAISAALFQSHVGEGRAGSGEMADMVSAFLSTMFGTATDEDFGIRLRIAAEIGDRLIAHAFAQSDPRMRQRVLDDAKRILAGYLFQ